MRSNRSAVCAAGVTDGEPEKQLMESIYITPEHELLRAQIARFIAREVEPHALVWEEQGFAPTWQARMGCMRDTAIERLWCDARVLAIGGGATEVMLDEVAKRY